MSTASSQFSSPFDVPPLSSVELPPLLSLSPSSFKVDVLLGQDVFLDLQLTNLTAQLLTFKIKTTARDRYLLKPTQDYIPPHSSRLCKIVLSAMSAYPDSANPKALKDKFLVQSAEVGVEVGDLGRYWKEREARHNVKEGRYAYAEQIVKCKLNVPTSAGGSGGSQLGGEGGRGSPVKVGDEREEREARAPDDAKDIVGKSSAAAAQGGAGSATRGYPALYPSVSSSSHSASTQPLPTTIHSTPGQGGASSSSTSSGYSRTPGDTQAGDGEGRRASEQQQHGAAPDSREQKQKEYNDVSCAALMRHPLPSAALLLAFLLSVLSLCALSSAQLMDFVVKLTAQMEREKADAAVLADKYNKALATINSQGKKIAVLQQMHAQHAPAVGTPSSHSSSSSTDPLAPRSPLTANDGGGDAKDDAVAASGRAAAAVAIGAGVRERLMSGEGVRNNSGGLSWQIYQVLLVAVIAFVLGRMLAK